MNRETPFPFARLGAACLLVAAGCASPPATDPQDTMNQISRDYVGLVLGLGLFDEHYVDAYYGPPEWKAEAERLALDLAALGTRAAELVRGLGPLGPVSQAPTLDELRRRFLARQLEALIARVGMLQGSKLGFDAESQALYDARSPHVPPEQFLALQAEIDRRLPGTGTTAERLDRFKQDFVIPPDKLDAVFRAAIAACRERTAAHVELPAGESFVVEYVQNQPWSAYNWYKGGFKSVIQVNTDLPIFIDRAIDLACHEGYPGHHVYNALLEKHLVRDRGWVEFSVYPLFSPQSLIAEGTANFGIRVAFPGQERVRFEAETLFPLAGLDPARAAEYYEVLALTEGLRYAGNEAARLYLDGEIDAAGAADWLSRYALSPRDRAEQRVRFFDRYRSYVINYNLGEDLVAGHVEALGGTVAAPERRWQVFGELLSSPRLPSLLARPAAP